MLDLVTDLVMCLFPILLFSIFYYSQRRGDVVKSALESIWIAGTVAIVFITIDEVSILLSKSPREFGLVFWWGILLVPVIAGYLYGYFASGEKPISSVLGALSGSAAGFLYGTLSVVRGLSRNSYVPILFPVISAIIGLGLGAIGGLIGLYHQTVLTPPAPREPARPERTRRMLWIGSLLAVVVCIYIWAAIGATPGSRPSADAVVLRDHEDWVFSVAFSPDGQTLASASRDKTIRLWDVTNPSADPIVLTGHEDAVLSVAFSPDGQTLASASSDLTIHLWDVTNPSADPIVLTGHEDNVWSVAFSPDGQTLASANKTIRLWDIANPTTDPIVLTTQGSSSIAFSPDGKILASASGDGTIRLWDVGGE